MVRANHANLMTREFQDVVMHYWKKEGRHTLPWRKTRDPYAILVSEIMLQQTQVDRVVPYFEKWIRRFPTVQSLAKAPLSDVLKEWSGLGYNRRAKLLRECAIAIVEKYSGKVPKDFAALVALPAIGPYTAGAIRAFAFDEPDIFIETNIRTALIHHFFPLSSIKEKARSQNATGSRIPDTQLIPLLTSLLSAVTHRQSKNGRALKKKQGKKTASSVPARGVAAISPREWYSALMDYGAHIKKTNENPSRRSTHHIQQSQFTGSLRQARGAILRTLVSGEANERKLREKTPPHFFKKALEGLFREAMIEKKGSTWQLAQK